MDKITRRFRGFLKIEEVGEFERVILIDDKGYVTDLIANLENMTKMFGNELSFRFWSSEKFELDEVIEEKVILNVMGLLEVKFDKTEYYYSEWTKGSYVHTRVKIGGHDIFDELQDHRDNWVIIEVSFDNN